MLRKRAVPAVCRVLHLVRLQRHLDGLIFGDERDEHVIPCSENVRQTQQQQSKQQQTKEPQVIPELQ